VYNRAGDVAVSAFNQRQVFSASFTLESPFGKPGLNSNRFLNLVAGGWLLNGIVQLGSGLPYSVTASTAILNDGGMNQERADQVGNPNGPKTTAEWFNTAAFANPAAYMFGNSKANSLVTDWNKNLDMSLFRQFRLGLGEKRYFEFRAEAFNLLNSTVFGYPDSNIGDANYGQVTGTLNQPRVLQLGLKFYF
jgi:hypothetical protein